jgi:hypothetical protein
MGKEKEETLGAAAEARAALGLYRASSGITLRLSRRADSDGPGDSDARSSSVRTRRPEPFSPKRRLVTCRVSVRR